MPVLYVVATPIGNLEDVTLRAVRILGTVDLIAAEDTRKTRLLLNKYGIKTPMTSYYEHNKLMKLEVILETLLEKDVALVSSAGMPGISDPGYELVKAAISRHIKVVPVPGASAVTAILAVAGLPTDAFTFSGFLPPRAAARRRYLEKFAVLTMTQVFMEAPHRLRRTLTDMLEICGNREIAVGRELTKIYEEVFRGDIAGALAHFQNPRGEFMIVLAGKKENGKTAINEDIVARIKQLKRDGWSARDAIDRLMGETNSSRKELYQAWLRQKKAE